MAPVCLFGAALWFPVVGQQAPPGSGTVIRTTAREVALDVIVRDSRGRQVKNLKAGSVEVYENGVRQEIRGFRLVQGGEAREPRAGGMQKRTAGVAPPSRLRPVNLVCIVYHNLLGDANTLKYTLESTQEFLGNTLQPGTYAGVFRLDSRLIVLHPFTDNRDALIQAARGAFASRPVEFSRAAEAVPDVNPASLSGSAAARPPAKPDEMRGGIAGSLAMVSANATASRSVTVVSRQHMDQLTSMLEQLSALPGHKTVLLFSPGIVNPEDPALFDAVIEKAHRAQVTVHTVDVLGPMAEQVSTGDLSRLAGVSARQRQVDPDPKTAMENMRQTDDVMTAVRSANSQAALRALAESTSGELIATYDLRKPFQHILEDVDTHYEITYRPSSEKLDGRLRSIQVKLAEPGLTASARSGYFAVPDTVGMTPAAFEAPGFAALGAEPRPCAFGAYSAALRFRPDAASSQYAIAFEVPSANVTATPDPERSRQRLHVSLLALVKDAGGQVIGKISRDYPLEVANEQLPALRAGSLSYAQPLQLAPGRYTVETAVVDHEGARASTNAVGIEVPAPRKGIAISSIVLVQRVEAAGAGADASDPFVFHGQRAVPLLATDLTPDSKPYVYFVVYPDRSSAEKPGIQVEFLVAGQVLAKQAAELPAPDASGAIPMVVGAAIRPGDCELRITALQGRASAVESVKYTVAAK